MTTTKEIAQLEKQFIQDLTLDITKFEQMPHSQTIGRSVQVRLAISLMRLYKLHDLDLGDHYNYTSMVEITPNGKLQMGIVLKLPTKQKPTTKIGFKLADEGFKIRSAGGEGVTTIRREVESDDAQA